MMEIHASTARHSVRDITLCDLTLNRVNLIIIDTLVSRDRYLTAIERIKSALRDGWRLKIYDAEITIDATLGLCIVECTSDQLELIK